MWNKFIVLITVSSGCTILLDILVIINNCVYLLLPFYFILFYFILFSTVIDFCLVKCLVCDAETNYQSLRMQWSSKASCIQRKGLSCQSVTFCWNSFMMCSASEDTYKQYNNYAVYLGNVYVVDQNEMMWVTMSLALFDPQPLILFIPTLRKIDR